jgi:spore coat polysaccharide biosynthesis protein SpsF
MMRNNDLRVVAIIEARMTSSRLPGKMMMPIGGRPSLQVLVERLRQAPGLAGIVVATTGNASDDGMVTLCERLHVPCFRGSEEDVLGRVLGAARFSRADVIVEITGDCTLIDPSIVQECIDAYMKNDVDFVANCVERPHYPPGMDARIFSTDVLAEVDSFTKDPGDREHVSLYIWEHPERYKLLYLRPPEDLAWPDKFIALDTKDDLEMLRRIYDALSPKNPFFSAHDIVAYLRANPEVSRLNDAAHSSEAS